MRNSSRHYGAFFFFSSRRRHTRCGRDWSSDVCSSDLSPIWVQPDQFRSGPPASPVGPRSRRSEERRVGKSVELGGRRIVKKKKKRWKERLYILLVRRLKRVSTVG